MGGACGSMHRNRAGQGVEAMGRGRASRTLNQMDGAVVVGAPGGLMHGSCGLGPNASYGGTGQVRLWTPGG